MCHECLILIHKAVRFEWGPTWPSVCCGIACLNIALKRHLFVGEPSLYETNYCQQAQANDDRSNPSPWPLIGEQFYT